VMNGSELIFEEKVFIRACNKIQEECYQIAKDKGWYKNSINVGELLSLIYGEVGELLETLRQIEPPQGEHIKEFWGAEEEAADIIIRVLSLGGLRGWRIGEAIVAKMNYNKTRAVRHNKRF